MKKFNILVLLTLPLILVTSIYAWDDCPHGEVNDPYPGECTKYIDTDKNGICDHSEPAPEDRTTSKTVTSTSEIKTDVDSKEIEESDHDELYSVEISGQDLKNLTVQEVADLWKVDSNILLNSIIKEFDLKGNYTVNSGIEDLRDEYKFSPSLIKDVAQKLADNSSIKSSTPTLESEKIARDNDTKEIIGIALLTAPIILLSVYLFINKFFPSKRNEVK